MEEDSRKPATGRELRRSKTASRILPAEFTVEEPRTFTSEEDENEASRKFEVSLVLLVNLLLSRVGRISVLRKLLDLRL